MSTKRGLLLAVCLLVACLVAVTGARAATAAASTAVRGAAVSTLTPTKVRYGQAGKQYVWMSRPAGSPKVRRPTVIFFHGGGWTAGSPGLWTQDAAFWVRHGWVTLNAGYRIGDGAAPTYDQGKAMLEDAVSALRLARSLSYVDKARIVLVGDSAGGHLAAYVAARYPSAVAGLMLWSAVASPAVAVQTSTEWDGVETTICASSYPCEKQIDLARRARGLFGYSMRVTDPMYYFTRAGRPKVPTWVAAGSDEWIPYEPNGGAICAQAGPDNCTVNLVPGTLHGTKLRDADPALLKASHQWAGRLAGL